MVEDDGEAAAYARRLYAEGVPVARIRADLKVGGSRLYRWLAGYGAGGELVAEPLPLRRCHPRTSHWGPKHRAALVDRIWRAAALQVRDIAGRLEAGGEGAATRERDARALAVVVRTMRELTAFDARDARKMDDGDDDTGPRDLDDFRRELAERLDRLRAEE
ncbi:hypothetical protein QNA08_12405 [Chelatococcus sp. SYSU_G07232]|uniref:Helix-turn-helix domain-containing protein n=1 Tax=Chelatococcus albus TaxID=3047466 RepID=A0ABT7AI49_9HYPH|nr:hypothetical protein [Chelatococcus sp. SYSU_G07232]MDJ1159038.1 hypothetical protein [Chelatococcus sp. SYSU_G07232]